MSSIVNASIQDYKQLSRLAKGALYNPFLPHLLQLPFAPSGSTKVQQTTDSAQAFDSKASFTMGSADLLRNTVLNVKLTYPTSHASVQCPAMSVIKNFQFKSENGGDITPLTNYADVTSHLRCTKTINWFWSAAEVAGGYTTSSGTEFTGSAFIWSPWCDAVTGVQNHAPFPLLKLGGNKSIKLDIYTESAANLVNANGDEPTAIELSLYYWATDIPTQVRQQLLEMPRYVLYTKEWQCLDSVAITTSDTNISGRFAQGRLISYVVVPRLDSSLPNKWILTRLIQNKLTMGNQVITQNISKTPQESLADNFGLGLARGNYASFGSPEETKLNSAWVYSFVGTGEDIASSGAGPKISDFNSINLAIASESASSQCVVMAEIFVAIELSEKAAVRYYP